MELCEYPCQCRRRCFTIEAIQIPIVYNQYGDYDPNGLLYVLEEDSQRIQKEAIRRFQQMPPQPYEEVQPLVLRVNLGDTVKVRFRNRLDRRLSIHVQGLSYDVITSDGSSVGFNPDSTTNNEIFTIISGDWKEKIRSLRLSILYQSVRRNAILWTFCMGQEVGTG